MPGSSCGETSIWRICLGRNADCGGAMVNYSLLISGMRSIDYGRALGCRYTQYGGPRTEGSTAREMHEAGNSPGSEVVILSHVFHHVIKPHLLVDIQPAAYLPVLLPREDHGCVYRRRGSEGLLRWFLFYSKSCAEAPKHLQERVPQVKCAHRRRTVHLQPL